MKENDIADSLRRMAFQFQAMTEAADAFDGIGSIKQSTEEANRLRDLAFADANKAKDDAAALTAKAKDLQDQADSVISNAQGNATSIISDAQLKADTIANDAAALMASTAANASNDAAALIALTKSNLTSSQDEITHNLAIKDGLDQEIARLQDLINQANDKLDTTRAAMKALVSGL